MAGYEKNQFKYKGKIIFCGMQTFKFTCKDQLLVQTVSQSRQLMIWPKGHQINIPRKKKC